MFLSVWQRCSALPVIVRLWPASLVGTRRIARGLGQLCWGVWFTHYQRPDEDNKNMRPRVTLKLKVKCFLVFFFWFDSFPNTLPVSCMRSNVGQTPTVEMPTEFHATRISGVVLCG